MTGSPSLSLAIASKLACVGPLGQQIRAACVGLGLTERAAGEIELSVVEAVNNAIEHAYQLAEDGVVEVVLDKAGPQLRVEVRDSGRQLPAGTLARVHAPDVDPHDPDSLPEGGMGLYILSQLMDAVRYESRAGKNSLIMERRIDRGHDD